MSNAVTLLCRPLRLSAAQKSVLMCIADFAHDNGQDWHSIAALMEWTCLGKTAVIDAMKSLEAMGLIRRVHRGNGLNSTTLVQIDAIEARPEVVTAREKTRANQSASRTSPPAEPVRQPNLTSPPNGLEPVRQAVRPVRQTDPKHQEASAKHQESIERRARATRSCPAEFEVTAELKAWAEREFPEVNISAETAKLRDHTFRTPIADWSKAWRNWIRRAREFGTASRGIRPQRPNVAGLGAEQQVQASLAKAARVAAMQRACTRPEPNLLVTQIAAPVALPMGSDAPPAHEVLDPLARTPRLLRAPPLGRERVEVRQASECEDQHGPT